MTKLPDETTKFIDGLELFFNNLIKQFRNGNCILQTYGLENFTIDILGSFRRMPTGEKEFRINYIDTKPNYNVGIKRRKK